MFERFPELMDAKDAMTALHISRSGVYSLMRSTDFPVVQINGRKLVLREELEVWGRQHMHQENKVL